MEWIKLWGNGTPNFDKNIDQKEPGLIPFLLEGEEIRPCVIVYPGGGYTHYGENEKEKIALWLNSIGFHSFVLEYRFSPYNYKAILQDALRAIRLVRYNAKTFRIDPDRIGILGFSAGGHLASMSALRHTDAVLSLDDPVDKISSRPDLAVLCYPVLSFEQFAHAGSVRHFLGDEFCRENLHKFSAETNVTHNAPPMFIWHTVEDQAVPVENSLILAAELQKNRVPFALHIYPNGLHGLNLAVDTKETFMWTEECKLWLYDNFNWGEE